MSIVSHDLDRLTTEELIELKDRLEGLIRGPDQKPGSENCLWNDRLKLSEVVQELYMRRSYGD